MKTCCNGHAFAASRCPHCATAYQRKYYTTRVKTSQSKWDARTLGNAIRYELQKRNPAWVRLSRLRSRITYERRAIGRLQDRIERKEVALLRMVKQRDLAADRLRVGKQTVGGIR